MKVWFLCRDKNLDTANLSKWELKLDFSKLRRYDVQAGWSLALAILSTIPLICALVLAYNRYDHIVGRIIYGSQGRFVPALLIGILASMVPSGVGFVMGWNSAGRRRNDKPARSWIGFFVGGTVLTLNLILLITFYMLRLEKPM